MENPTAWHYTRRKLPHFHPQVGMFFVTYRLAHTVSALERDRLRALYPGKNASHEQHAEYFNAYDFVLDAARHGPKYLEQPEIRDTIKTSLHFADTEGWIELIAYSIMSNHVHFIAELIGDKSLSQVMHSLKGFTARECNKILNRTGNPFWEDESYDTVIREGRLGNSVRYVLMNPVKAALVSDWRDWSGTYLSPNFYGIESLGLKAR